MYHALALSLAHSIPTWSIFDAQVFPNVYYTYALTPFPILLKPIRDKGIASIVSAGC